MDDMGLEKRRKNPCEQMLARVPTMGRKSSQEDLKAQSEENEL
jgi:hypothetical protein